MAGGAKKGRPRARLSSGGFYQASSRKPSKSSIKRAKKLNRSKRSKKNSSHKRHKPKSARKTFTKRPKSVVRAGKPSKKPKRSKRFERTWSHKLHLQKVQNPVAQRPTVEWAASCTCGWGTTTPTTAEAEEAFQSHRQAADERDKSQRSQTRQTANFVRRNDRVRKREAERDARLRTRAREGD